MPSAAESSRRASGRGRANLVRAHPEQHEQRAQAAEIVIRNREPLTELRELGCVPVVRLVAESRSDGGQLALEAQPLCFESESARVAARQGVLDVVEARRVVTVARRLEEVANVVVNHGRERFVALLHKYPASRLRAHGPPGLSSDLERPIFSAPFDRPRKMESR